VELRILLGSTAVREIGILAGVHVIAVRERRSAAIEIWGCDQKNSEGAAEIVTSTIIFCAGSTEVER
jgi:hypothetical protein